MRALIFGGNGMLGRDLALALQMRGHHAVALGHGDADITQLGAVNEAVRRTGPEIVFNCAAYTKVDQAETDMEQAFAVNAHGAGNVSLAASLAGVPVVHVSTDYVFDGSRTEGYLEEAPLAPLSAYGRSKAEGEERVRCANPHHLIVRTQWLYGAGGPNFVRTMLRLGKQRTSVQVVDDQIGSPTYTPDLANALVFLAERNATGTYHVTNSGTCSWREFAQAIFGLAGMAVDVEPITTAKLGRPAPRPLNSVLLNHRWRQAGYPPLRPYAAALADYMSQAMEESV